MPLTGNVLNDPHPREPVSAAVRPATILQVVPALVTGGVERGTVDVAAAIVQGGGNALVASAGGPMVHELERSGARHITLPLDRKTPWAIARNAQLLAALIEAEHVDIVHARSRAPAWSALRAARRTGRPFVTTFHGVYNFSGRLKHWYNSVMARGDRVIATSDYIARHIIENYGGDPARIRLIHRGVDVALLDPRAVKPDRVIALAREWRLPDGVPVIMLPGRVTRWKGHQVLLQALARLGRRDLLCLIVGPEDSKERYRRELEAQVESLGLAGLVRFVGLCRDMPSAYMLADVVVSASTDAEGFGRIAAEASAMGRPVVATDHGGARETVVPGETGWLVPPADADALAAALDAALGLHSSEREALGLRAQAHIRASFTKDRMCADTLALYAEILQGQSPA
jgi:glycosyltransferase involved in cell wall biosynthesis